MLHAMQAVNIDNYLVDDTIFNKINKLFISLDPVDVKEKNHHLSNVYEKLIEVMRSQSLLFDKTYKKPVWAGSFYKKTKIGSPDEYDLNLIFHLPIQSENINFYTNQPGYTKICINTTAAHIRDVLKLNNEGYRELKSFIDDDLYLDQEKFRRWIERVLTKAANFTDTICSYRFKFNNYTITIRKSGPAFTLSLLVGNEDISIDLVPVLAFSGDKLPPYDSNWNLQDFPKRYWFAVPKPLNNRNICEHQHYWRLSFYEYEKDILDNTGQVKPIIRQLKKLRDTQEWNSIASYYIETLCLHNLDIFKTSKSVSFTFVFFKMLEKLYEAFQNHCIKSYWTGKLNLLENISNDEMINMERRLFRIINIIKRDIASDRSVIAKYVLNKRDYNILITELAEGKQSSKLNESELETASQWNCIII